MRLTEYQDYILECLKRGDRLVAKTGGTIWLRKWSDQSNIKTGGYEYERILNRTFFILVDLGLIEEPKGEYRLSPKGESIFGLPT